MCNFILIFFIFARLSILVKSIKLKPKSRTLYTECYKYNLLIYYRLLVKSLSKKSQNDKK